MIFRFGRGEGRYGKGADGAVEAVAGLDPDFFTGGCGNRDFETVIIVKLDRSFCIRGQMGLLDGYGIDVFNSTGGGLNPNHALLVRREEGNKIFVHLDIFLGEGSGMQNYYDDCSDFNQR